MDEEVLAGNACVASTEKRATDLVNVENRSGADVFDFGAYESGHCNLVDLVGMVIALEIHHEQVVSIEYWVLRQLEWIALSSTSAVALD